MANGEQAKDPDDRALELYKLEYEKAADRYDNVYRPLWTIFSYLTAVTAGILALGYEKFQHHALICIAASGPVVALRPTFDILGDVIEFASGDTPRCVEKPGTLSLPRTVALAMLQRVYGFAPVLTTGQWRVEFSIHPLPRGYRQEHTILWEAERETAMQRAPRPRWPNHFSRLLGDKAFGLLLADCFGFPVPSTTVIGRKCAPFTFGRSTGTGETWIRTCPREPVPGKFTTLRGWTDPFKLLDQEDPEGRELASVLSQEGVRAAFSGASIRGREREADCGRR